MLRASLSAVATNFLFHGSKKKPDVPAHSENNDSREEVEEQVCGALLKFYQTVYKYEDPGYHECFWRLLSCGWQSGSDIVDLTDADHLFSTAPVLR